MELPRALPLSQHDLLSRQECDDISDRVLSLREDWIPRSGSGFFSLATASYLDAPGLHEEYIAAARHTNVTLQKHFADVYEILRSFFAELFGEPVEMAEDLALPGFHIFEFDGRSPAHSKPASRAHFDLQWMNALPGRCIQGTLSFTVAVEQPSGGAAMQVWPLRRLDLGSRTVAVREYAQTHASRRIAYSDGSVTIHDGHILHAIGSSERDCPRGRRVTLQGHGALLDGTWILYW